MAKVTNPLMSQDARGSVAGVQFSKNTAGAFGSRKSTSTRSQQPGAIAYRAQLGAAHHAWNALSDAQKATWNLTPDTHVKPKEHFLKLYLARAARDLTQWMSYPGDKGEAGFAELEVLREDDIRSRFTVSWAPSPVVGSWICFELRMTYRLSYDGHPRKFRIVETTGIIPPYTAFDPKYYGPYATLHVSVRDEWSLRPYRRWVFHFDKDVLISVTPDLP